MFALCGSKPSPALPCLPDATCLVLEGAAQRHLSKLLRNTAPKPHPFEVRKALQHTGLARRLERAMPGTGVVLQKTEPLSPAAAVKTNLQSLYAQQTSSKQGGGEEKRKLYMNP